MDKNSPAEKAGLAVNCAIIQINGVTVTSWIHQKVVRTIKQQSGKPIQLHLEYVSKAGCVPPAPCARLLTCCRGGRLTRWLKSESLHSCYSC